jgi:hypothetical protein
VFTFLKPPTALALAAALYISCERDSGSRNYLADFNVIWQEYLMVNVSHLGRFWVTLTSFEVNIDHLPNFALSLISQVKMELGSSTYIEVPYQKTQFQYVYD